MADADKNPVPARDGSAAPARKARRKPRAADVQHLLPLAEAAPPPAPPRLAAATSRLWFCVYLPALALDAGGRSKAPLAVVEEQQGLHRVVLANPAAVKAGVQPGQSSNAALALVPELELLERSPAREQQALETLAGWLESFSSQVSIAAEDVLLFEVAGSLRLFGGLPALRQQVAAGLRQRAYAAELAIAPTPLAATWLARAGRRACVRDAANLLPRLRDLPLDCLDWPAATTAALHGMGVATLGECLRLPRDGFTKRFGAGRLLQLDRGLGRLPDPRRSWRAPERFCADIDLNEEQSDVERLLLICSELLDAHERFLRARQLGTQRIAVSFYHLRAPATRLTLGVSRPERSAACFAELLGMRFERLKLPEPVIAVRLEGGSTQALQAESAALGFSGTLRSRPGYSMSQLAERLAARIGSDAVHGVTTVADHRPQKAWRPRRLPAASAQHGVAAGKAAERPLWLLPEPAMLPVEQGLPLHFGRLQLLDGPERLETGWWDDAAIARDYYTAVNPRGMRLWVFRDRARASDWYLDGVFG